MGVLRVILVLSNSSASSLNLPFFNFIICRIFIKIYNLYIISLSLLPQFVFARWLFKKIIADAQGNFPAQLFLQNCRLFTVFLTLHYLVITDIMPFHTNWLFAFSHIFNSLSSVCCILFPIKFLYVFFHFVILIFTRPGLHSAFRFSFKKKERSWRKFRLAKFQR